MSTQPPANLLALPEELIAHILPLVYEDDHDLASRHRSFCRLSTVCKSFQSILAPALNREIQWDLGGDRNGAIVMTDISRHMRCPDHTELVTAVAIRGCQTKQLAANFMSQQLTDFERGHIREWFEELKLSDSYWEHLNIGQIDYLAALWSTRLTHLHSLDFDALNCTADDRYDEVKPHRDIAFSEVIKQSLTTDLVQQHKHSVPFGSLRSVRVIADWQNAPAEFDETYGVHVYLENVLPFFYLSNVETLEFHGLVLGSTQSWPSFSPSATSLKTLVLEHSDIGEDALNLMLQACPNLEVLKYEITLDADSVAGWLKAPKLGKSLHLVKRSLQYLDFKVNLWASTAIDITEWGPWGVEGSLGSFQDFVQLKSLSISWPLLLGWSCKTSVELADILPGNLQHLCLTDDVSSWWAYQWLSWLDMNSGEYVNDNAIEFKIKSYLQARPQGLKRLSIEFNVSAGFASPVKKLGSILQAFGTSAGVEVEVIRKKSFA